MLRISVFLFVLLALSLSAPLLPQDEQVKARPAYAEFHAILGLLEDECYKGSVNERLDCSIAFLTRVRREGVGAFKHTPDEKDLTKDEKGVEIKSRRSSEP